MSHLKIVKLLSFSTYCIGKIEDYISQVNSYVS